MVEGLRETSEMLFALLEREGEEVGMENVVLGGLSQGAAAAVVAALLWIADGRILGGLVGLCARLPLAGRIMEALREGDQVEEDGVLFAVEEAEVDEEEVRRPITPLKKAAAALGEVIGFELPTASVSKATTEWDMLPLLLAHGIEDQTVPIQLGRQARDCFQEMGAEVEWLEQLGLGHWYSDEILAAIVPILERSGF